MYIEDGAVVFELSELIADYKPEYANYRDLSLSDRCYVVRELALSLAHFVECEPVDEPYSELCVYGLSYGGFTSEFKALLLSHLSLIDYMPYCSLFCNGRMVCFDLSEA